MLLTLLCVLLAGKAAHASFLARSVPFAKQLTRTGHGSRLCKVPGPQVFNVLTRSKTDKPDWKSNLGMAYTGFESLMKHPKLKNVRINIPTPSAEETAYNEIGMYLLKNRGNPEKCKELIKLHGERLLGPDFLHPPIPFMAVAAGNTEILEYWINCGLSMDVLDRNGFSLWYYLPHQMSTELKKLLIQAGPLCKNQEGIGSLPDGVMDGDLVFNQFLKPNFDAIDLLVEKGASLDLLHLLAGNDVEYDPTQPPRIYAKNIYAAKAISYMLGETSK